MSRKLILAHDLGTSGDKACLFDITGDFLAEAYYTYKTYYPAENYVEHDPRTWWEAVANSSKDVIQKAGASPEDVKAVSFSAHGMGVIPVDKSGELLVDRVMIWNDTRSTKEAKHIIERTGEREHYEKTGNSFDLALYPASKILWIKRNMPDVYKKTYKFLSTKEYLINKMTGMIKYTDYGESGMSGLFNLNTHQWDAELLNVSEVDEEKLLIPTDGTQVMGGLTKAAAEEMGLCKDTPVVLGSWDNYACATGAGVRSGSMAVCLGTAGWIGINHSKPIMTPDSMTNVVYVGNGTYFTSVHSHSAGASYDWVINKLCTYLQNNENPLKLAEELASKVPAGSDKLFFLPSMFAGNTFYSSSALCGSLVGMKMLQDNGHIIRAAMEGVGFDLMMGSDLFRREGAMPDMCNLIGGGANSTLWGQIIASMFGSSMMRPKNLQYIGALGAALFAGVGTGMIKDFEMAAQITKSENISLPNPSESAVYQKLLPVYRRFYEQLMPVYEELQEIQL
ncbi:MAG: FGGY family carbohydrate kinase [Oscillospiraceae bacterium]|nr:FGGY family carbohydrate kinase [Oscillospiraceae bacterium]